MAEPALSHAALIFLAAFNATPLLVPTAAVLIAWQIAALSDGPSALMVFRNCRGASDIRNPSGAAVCAGF